MKRIAISSRCLEIDGQFIDDRRLHSGILSECLC